MSAQVCHRCGNAWPDACTCIGSGPERERAACMAKAFVYTNQLGDELSGDDLLIVQAARLIERGIGTRSDTDSLSVLRRRLNLAAQMATIEHKLQRLQFEGKKVDDEADRLLDKYLAVAESAIVRLAEAEKKLASIRVLAMHDKPLIGQQVTPRFLVSGWAVVRILEEP